MRKQTGERIQTKSRARKEKQRQDLQKSLAGYLEPHLLCRKEYRPFLFCKNFFILTFAKRAACSHPKIQCVLSKYVSKASPLTGPARLGQTDEMTESKPRSHPCNLQAPARSSWPKW